MWSECASPDCPDSLCFHIVFLLLMVINNGILEYVSQSYCEDVKLVEVKHDVKPDKVNDNVQPYEASGDVKPGARPTGV